MGDALRINEDHLLDDLRRATRGTNGGRPATNDQTCAMHGLPYLDGRHGCERCLALFAPTSGKRAASFAAANANRHNAYSPGEMHLVCDGSLSNAEVARRTGRSVIAIKNKRLQDARVRLALKGNSK